MMLLVMYRRGILSYHSIRSTVSTDQREANRIQSLTKIVPHCQHVGLSLRTLFFLLLC